MADAGAGDCEAGDPGNGQVCAWRPYYNASASLQGDALDCNFSEAVYLCVQELGETGGTTFGSCGGDGTPPVYYRPNGDNYYDLLQTDGFFTPEGFSPCDCHDGAPDPDDPLACCCVCDGQWPG